MSDKTESASGIRLQLFVPIFTVESRAVAEQRDTRNNAVIRKAEAQQAFFKPVEVHGSI